jgi:hypothetical protein
MEKLKGKKKNKKIARKLRSQISKIKKKLMNKNLKVILIIPILNTQTIPT